MKNKLLLSLGLCLSTMLLAQKASVLDESSLQAIENVLVYSKDSSIVQSTDVKGHYDISKFVNVDSVYFEKEGYEKSKASVRDLYDQKLKYYISEQVHALEEVVFSASKFEEKRKDVPQQIQVIKARDIEFMNQQTTADVLQSTGNVFVQKSQMGGGSPVIRGFEANKVLMVVDGVRMNNAIYRGGHLQNIITMDNNTLEKVEVVSGPGSVVYGSDALGGVVHFYTKNPALADHDSALNIGSGAFLRTSTANKEKTGNIHFNIGLKKIGFFTSFTYSDFDDLRQGERRNPFYGGFGERNYYAARINNKDSMVVNTKSAIQKYTGYQQYDFLQKVLFKPTAHQSHMLNLQYSTSSDIPRYDRLTEISKGVLRHAEWYYGPQKRLMAAYTLNLEKETFLYEHARFIAAYQDLEESRHNRNFNSSKLNHRIENVNVITFNLDLSKELGKHELRYGLEFAHNSVNSSATLENINTGEKSPLDTRYPGGGSYMRSMAAYVTHTYEVSPKFIVSDGLRYSFVQLESKFVNTFFPFPFTEVRQASGALNGNLGFIYMPGKDWRFVLLGSTGFRAPNVDDLSKVFDSSPGKVVVPNPNLKPEYTYNLELSTSKLISNQVKLEATGFYTWFANVLAIRPTTFDGKDSIDYDGTKSQVVAQSNQDKAYLYGGYVGMSTEISKIFSFGTSLNYTYGRVVTDTLDVPLDHIPPVYGRTYVSMKLKRFKGEFSVLYNGWKRLKDYSASGEDNQVYATPQGMPAWYTLNLRTSYQFNKYLQLQVALENILDQNYRVFASGVSAAGRNLVLTLRGNF